MSAAPTCRSCAHTPLAPVLSLGRTPLANALLTGDGLHRPEPTFPLDLAVCPACTLVQITETVPPETLFGDYLYFSSFSDTMVRHAHDLAMALIDGRHLDSASLVVEVASNDGYLLQHYQQQQIPVLGIEPARNISQVATERGIPTRCEFFGRESASCLRAEGIEADVIHANNVMAHVADLPGFVAGMAMLLKPAGIAVIEAPYVKDMLDQIEFDTIYHEHLCYFSLTAVQRLALAHGLHVVDVAWLPIHGGSLRYTLARADGPERPTAAVTARLAEETDWGVGTLAPYERFASRVTALRESLRGLLQQLKAEGRRIAAYGASAKGSTLLNFCGIGRELLDFVADRSTYKQGRYTPGTHLPIAAPERLLADRPDYVLLLTWNFAEEILSQQAAYREAGGHFIIPVPEPHVV